MYPGYAHKPRHHALAWDDGEQLATADGEVLPSDTYTAWLESAIAHRLDVRCDSILGWRYFREAIRDPKATVSAAQSKSDANPRAVCIDWRRGNDWCKLYESSAWGDGNGAEAIETHQAAIDHLGVGVYASPSSLGQATMRARFRKGYTTLCEPVTRELLENIVGGRAECDQPGEWPTAVEEDRTMAYVAECRKPLPVGAATFIGNATLEEANVYPFWYGRCVAIIARPLPKGPFPLRTNKGGVTYPKRPGQFTVYLWKGEAEDAIRAGVTIIPQRLWAWTRSEPVLAAWAERMYTKRREAPSEQVASYVKRAAVAAIGWHAMAPRRLVVRLASTLPTTALPIVNRAGFPTSYAVEVLSESQPRQMVHWASYIWSEARRTLYARELAELQAGNTILASNFDSLVLLHPTALPTARELGEWRTQVLTNVQITASRQLVSDQKVTTPGIPPERRAEALAAGKARWLAERQDAEAEKALWEVDHPAEAAREKARRSRGRIKHDWQELAYWIRENPEAWERERTAGAPDPAMRRPRHLLASKDG